MATKLKSSIITDERDGAPHPQFRWRHPGQILRDEFLRPWRMTPYRLAKGLRVTPTRVGEILSGKRSMTADTALRLAAFLGTTPDVWLNYQRAYDFERERGRLAGELAAIEPYVHTGSIYLDNGDGTEDVVTDAAVAEAA